MWTADVMLVGDEIVDSAIMIFSHISALEVPSGRVEPQHTRQAAHTV